MEGSDAAAEEDKRQRAAMCSRAVGCAGLLSAERAAWGSAPPRNPRGAEPKSGNPDTAQPDDGAAASNAA